MHHVLHICFGQCGASRSFSSRCIWWDRPLLQRPELSYLLVQWCMLNSGPLVVKSCWFHFDSHSIGDMSRRQTHVYWEPQSQPKGILVSCSNSASWLLKLLLDLTNVLFSSETIYPWDQTIDYWNDPQCCLQTRCLVDPLSNPDGKFFCQNMDVLNECRQNFGKFVL